MRILYTALRIFYSYKDALYSYKNTLYGYKNTLSCSDRKEWYNFRDRQKFRKFIALKYSFETHYKNLKKAVHTLQLLALNMALIDGIYSCLLLDEMFVFSFHWQ